LRYNDQRLRAACPSELDQRPQALAGSQDPALDGSTAAVGKQPGQQRAKAPVLHGRLPDQPCCQARAIVEEVAIEQGRHEQRHHSNRLAKARQLSCQAQIGLVAAVVGHRQVGALNPQQRARAGGYRLVPREPESGNDGFASEKNCGLLGVHSCPGP